MTERKPRSLKQQIAATELAIEATTLLAQTYGRRSDLGWIISIVASAGGTAVAVDNAVSERHWWAEMNKLQEHLIQLRIESAVLDRHRGADSSHEFTPSRSE